MMLSGFQPWDAGRERRRMATPISNNAIAQGTLTTMAVVLWPLAFRYPCAILGSK